MPSGQKGACSWVGGALRVETLGAAEMTVLKRNNGLGNKLDPKEEERRWNYGRSFDGIVSANKKGSRPQISRVWRKKAGMSKFAPELADNFDLLVVS